MAACSCLFRNPLPWLAALGSFLAYAYCSEFRFLTILLTSSAVILYPVIISGSKLCQQKLTHHEDSLTPREEEAAAATTTTTIVGDSNGSLEHETFCPNVECNIAGVEYEEASKGSEISEKNEDIKGRDDVLSSSETLSDSESFDHTTSSEDSENDWNSRENLSHSTQFSDGSISDEESLIEITLPEGHYVESSKKQEEHQQQSCYVFQQKWPDCSIKSHFRQPNWMEMLMEEENLIEIDIGMGSIKYSRFEIKA